jgi:hypothetical protein
MGLMIWSCQPNPWPKTFRNEFGNQWGNWKRQQRERERERAKRDCWFIPRWAHQKPDMSAEQKRYSLKFSRELKKKNKTKQKHTSSGEICDQIFISGPCTVYWIILFGFFLLLLFWSECICTFLLHSVWTALLRQYSKFTFFYILQYTSKRVVNFSRI